VKPWTKANIGPEPDTSTASTPAGYDVGDRQATVCATFVDEWVRGGISHAVVCPGSRSTPLALALSDRADAGDLVLRVVLDERSAAFVALGLGRATGRPAVLLCTSGTAAANFLPAVVESGLSDVPLLVVTADRPPELHDVGAPQTIDQRHLFGRHARWTCDPGSPADLPEGSWRSLAARARLEAASGPVHLNLAFREPLVATAGVLPPGREQGRPWHRQVGDAVALLDPDEVAAVTAGASRPVIVAGEGAGPEGALTAAAALGWPVLCDHPSGWRVPSPVVVSTFDAMLRVPAFAASHRPDLVVHLGRPPASKVLAQWSAATGAHHVVVHRRRILDPDRMADVVVVGAAGHLLPQVEALGDAVPSPDWLASSAARAVIAALPAGAALVVSSSMPVRDLEWYGPPRQGLTVHANRGANGIDGVVSTALGVAAADPTRPTVALVGDLAFLHDAGALAALVSGPPVPLTIVVIDNQGGGIFSFLPQAQALDRARFEALYGTPQPVDLAALVAAHGLPVETPATVAKLSASLTVAIGRGTPGVIVVPTDRGTNVAVHDEIHAAVAAAIS